MKRFRLILLAALSAAALLSCEKAEEDVFLPADIEGTWVFSASNDGKGWKDLKVSSILEFNGKGAYSVKSLAAGAVSVTFYNGQVYAEEDAFSKVDAKLYRVTHSDLKYHFESVPGDFVLALTTANDMVFDYSGEAAVSGYKLSKVEKFAASVEPEPEPQPEPEPDKINGTQLIEGNDLVGLIKDAVTGKGIPGVVVSDGYDCVTTDQNGVYQFKSNALSRVVYYSTPSDYKVKVSNALPSVPVFYNPVKPTGEVIRTDFSLEPLPGGSEKNWTFVGIGDPQCATSGNADRYAGETIPDIVNAVSGRTSVYAMTLGDIVFDSTNMWSRMRTTMGNVNDGAWTIPFFQTIGNHDHDSLKPDTTDDVADDYNATSTFVGIFGPTDYSFNRGDVHIISMDDIIVTSQKTSSKSNGKTWNYGSGFTDKQWEWLKKDLALVPGKQNKMVFICCHIPFRGSNSNHYMDVVKLLTEFKEVHLMIGHTHYTQNYVYNSTKAKGGLPVYEHIHGSACGAWWTGSCSSTVTGEPSGYTVYEIEGAHIADWKFKGTNRKFDDQLRVFDGNDVYYETGSYPLVWYQASQKAGSSSITIKGNASLKQCFVAQVFNDDDTYWRVELRSKSTGNLLGVFSRLSNGLCTNVAMSAYWFNAKGKNSTSYNSTTASHYWYCKPASGKPSEETDWEVVAIQTIPGGAVTHSYSCSTITKQADFAKAFYF